MKRNPLFIIFSITLSSALGLASVTPALPKIASSLNINEKDIGLIFTVFAAPSLLLTPLLGFLADIFGRKKVLIPSLFLFGIAGFMCFFATDFKTLLIFRFIEGIGASALGAINVTLIGDYYKDNDRAKIMGFNNSVLGICTALFPIFGGLLSKIDWNYIFVLPLLAIPIGIISIYKIDDNFTKSNLSIKDYFSGIFNNLKNSNVISLFSISAIAFIILFGAFLTYSPFFLTKNFQADSFKIGLIISSMSVFMAIFSSVLGKISKKFNFKSIILISVTFYAISMILIPTTNHILMYLLPTFLFGFAHGITIPTVQNEIAGKFDIKQRAAFMSINRMVAQIGQAIGPFLTGLILANFGLNFVFYFGSILILITILIIYKFIK